MKKKANTAARYDEPMRRKIGAFLKTHTNQAAKKEFGCSAHFAGKLRHQMKIPDVAAQVAAPPKQKKAAAKGGKKKAHADLL